MIYICSVPRANDIGCQSNHATGYGKHTYDQKDKFAIIRNLDLHESDPASHSCCTARVVAVVHSSHDKNMNSFASSNYILDTQFPAMEPSCRECHKSILGKRFGIPFLHDNTIHS